MKLAGFTIQDLMYAVGETVVARALDSSGKQVVLKYQNASHPSLDWSARWQHEHAVLQSVDSPWIIKTLGITQAANSQVLILEDFASANLAQLIELDRLDFADRLSIASQLAAALSDVHRHGLIHGDISPKNVLVDSKTLKVKLCDFGLSSRLDREPKRPESAYLRGTLEYMSPERTGRTNLEVDYRSDFYSLGVTLYELLLGRQPFRSDDPMALLHLQIASMPAPLHEEDRSIPLALSRIVHKLLAKSPDDRYQSSRGLQADLQDCLIQWQANGRIDAFAPGRMDIPERFCLSQKLYGREEESAALLAAFERCASRGRAELVLVSGYSGIGKSSLVNQLHKPVVARRAYFTKGKCEQYSRNQPYGALIAAFEPLMRQLASEGQERRTWWASQLRTALGNSAAAVTSLVPDLRLLIGEPGPLQQLPAGENENRFHIAFAAFVRAIASGGRALVLFLDDLQWADVATLRLIEHLLAEGEECGALIIGAYRDNEVDATHPLALALASIERSGRAPARLQLSNLSLAHVTELVSDTLRCTLDEAAPLAALCHDKTGGNPFFLGQFLGALVDDGEIRYARAQGAWQWDTAHIRRRNMTDNVVELMLERLHKLDSATCALLSQAAHLGNGFDMEQLMAVSENSAIITAATLWPALQAGLVVPMNEDYKFDGTPEKLRDARYRFLHDRVQQAARSLTPEAERKQLQLRTGRLLLASATGEQLDARLFAILDQMNGAAALIDDPAERARLLELNIRGGVKAKASSAYGAAVNLLRAGRGLLPADAWQTAPAQALALFRELAEAEYLAGNFDAAELLYAEALTATSEPLANVTMQLVQLDQYHIQGRFSESLPVLMSAFERFGRPFPADDGEAGAQFPAAFGHTSALLAQRTEAELLGAPESTDPQFLLTMRLYFVLSYATYQTGRFGQFVLGACRFLETTMEHGQSDLTAVAHVQFVTAMSVAGTPYPQCYAQGKLAMTLAEQREDKYFRLTIYQYFSAFYQHWREPLEATFPYLEKGMGYGQEGINALSAGYCALLGAANKLGKGVQLETLVHDCEQGIKFLQRSQQPNTEAMLRVGVLHPVLALQGLTESPLSFDTLDSSASGFFNGDFDTPSIHLALYSAAMIRHAYLLDDAALWQQFSARLPIVGMCLPDSPSMVDATFYTAMGLLNDATAGEGGPAAGLERAIGYRDTFARWAEGCAANFSHKHLLLSAEVARVQGDSAAAIGMYAQAIEAARDAGFAAFEALANERYARYWQGMGQQQLAANLVREAYFHYRRWGATVKCNWLVQNWPQAGFSVGERKAASASSTTSYKSGVSEHSGLLDMQSLLKANQLLAEEIQLDALLERILGVLLENAGAEEGAIVLEEEGELVVEAMGRVAPGQQVDCTRVGLPMAHLGDSPDPLVPDAIITHVRDTQRTLILNNPAEDPRFSYNTYLRNKQPKSVMCLPVLSQGKLVAIVYLENNLLPEAFTPRHRKTLELLSSQAAISLVHARLYERLEEKVGQRTAELKAMAMKDGLTAIPNRRSFDERLNDEWRRGVRSGQPLSLLMVDIDHFKLYNDHYGHLEGDACIRAVARALADVASRPTDMVARYGGEEFAVLMSDADAQSAQVIAERCLAAVAALGLPHLKSGHGKVTISVGIATVRPAREDNPDSLIGQADKALYAAKREGRNRLAVY